MPEIDILIKAVDQASAPAKTVDTALKNMGNTAKDTGTKMTGLQTVTSGVGNVLKAGLTAALVGAGAAMAGMTLFIKDGVDKARESIEIHKQLEQVIKSTGGAAGVTAQQAEDLATSLSHVTNFSEDAITGGENLLLTFTNIGQDVFPQATQTILDMSQALGQDLKSSAIQLGKALNDPEKGITALTRVGVSFTEQQKEMIKTMQAAGDTAGAQKLILAELAKEFGGSAQALADPATQLQHAWDELQKNVGQLVIPLLNNLARAVLPYLQGAAEAVGKAVQNFYGYFNEGDSILESAKWAIYDLLPDGYKDRWEAFVSAIQGAMNTITGTVQTQLGLIRLAWDLNLDGIRTSTTQFSIDSKSQFDELLTTLNEIVANGTPAVKFNWTDMLTAMARVAEAKSTEILGNVNLFFKLIRDEQMTFTALFKGDWQGFWNGIKLTLNTVTDAMLDDVQNKWGPGMRNAFASAFNQAWDGMKSVWTNIAAWWNNTVGALITASNTVASNLGLPNPFASVPTVAPSGVSTPPGGGGGTASTSSLGGVTVTQHFYGQTDPTTVHDAASSGVLTAARSMGLR